MVLSLERIFPTRCGSIGRAKSNRPRRTTWLLSRGWGFAERDTGAWGASEASSLVELTSSEVEREAEEESLPKDEVGVSFRIRDVPC